MIRRCLMLLVLVVSTELAGAAAPPRYGRPLETVVVTAESAPVLVADKTVATATKGQWFGVRQRKEGRVAIQTVVGTAIRTGWLREEDVRVLSDDEVDLAAEALRLARTVRPDIDVAAYTRRMAALARAVDVATQKTSTPLHKAQAISRHLFLAERFTYKRDNRRLDETLDSRRGNCFSLSILYLCAARNTGLPIHLVAVPGHAYLRCDDGKTPFNIEPSMGGIIFTGERPAFRRRRPLGGIHLKLLTRAQTVGLLHSDLGAALGRAGRYDAACTHFARAIEIAPEIAEAYCDWGVALAHLKHWAPACDKFSRAILAHRHYAEAYYGWGAALARMGQHAWACDKFARAVEVNPGYADAWFNWGSMLLATGQTRDGVDKLERAARLNPSLRPAVERLRSAIPPESPRP